MQIKDSLMQYEVVLCLFIVFNRTTLSVPSLAQLTCDTTIDGLGLPADSLLLQGDPDRLGGDRGEGAGGGFSSVELPAGKLTSGRERSFRQGITISI
jgi:hypothetical protein